MGQPDLYPFVLSQPAIEKLGFIHRLVHGTHVPVAQVPPGARLTPVATPVATSEVPPVAPAA